MTRNTETTETKKKYLVPKAVKHSINGKVQTDSVRTEKTFNSSLDILLVIDIHYVKCVVLEGLSALDEKSQLHSCNTTITL